jgi:hypothetical protein
MLNIGQLFVLAAFCAAFGVMLASQHSKFGDMLLCTILAVVVLQLSYLFGSVIVG